MIGGHTGIHYLAEAAATRESLPSTEARQARSNSNSTSNNETIELLSDADPNNGPLPPDNGPPTPSRTDSDVNENEQLQSPHDIFATEKEQANKDTAPTASATESTASQPKKITPVPLTQHIKSCIESKLIHRPGKKNSGGKDRVEIAVNMNKIIRNRNGILRAAKEGNVSLYQRLDRQIPRTEVSVSKAKKPEIVPKLVNIYAILFELFQCKKFMLSDRIMDDLGVFIDIMEVLVQESKAEFEREKKIDDKLLKGVALSNTKMQRRYLEGGGALLTEADYADGLVKVDACPKCGLKMFDKEPDYDANKESNTELEEGFIATREHIDEYTSGTRDDPPICSKTGKVLQSISNLVLKPHTALRSMPKTVFLLTLG
jgi:hypothetical protein